MTAADSQGSYDDISQIAKSSFHTSNLGQTQYIGGVFGSTKKSIDQSYHKTTLYNGSGNKGSSNQVDNMRGIAGRTVSNNMKKQIQ